MESALVTACAGQATTRISTQPRAQTRAQKAGVRGDDSRQRSATSETERARPGDLGSAVGGCKQRRERAAGVRDARAEPEHAQLIG
jgi:hypothetical protein